MPTMAYINTSFVSSSLLLPTVASLVGTGSFVIEIVTDGLVTPPLFVTVPRSNAHVALSC